MSIVLEDSDYRNMLANRELLTEEMKEDYTQAVQNIVDRGNVVDITLLVKGFKDSVKSKGVMENLLVKIEGYLGQHTDTDWVITVSSSLKLMEGVSDNWMNILIRRLLDDDLIETYRKNIGKLTEEDMRINVIKLLEIRKEEGIIEDKINYVLKGLNSDSEKDGVSLVTKQKEVEDKIFHLADLDNISIKEYYESSDKREECIRNIEEKERIIIPRAYKDFIVKFGGWSSSFEVNGISYNNNCELESLTEIKREKEDCIEYDIEGYDILEKKLLIDSTDGYLILLDIPTGILIGWEQYNNACVGIYKNFNDYVLDMLDSFIEDAEYQVKERLNSIISRLKNDESRHTLTDGISEEDIVKLENSLGVRLPYDYREFLKVTNGAEINTNGVTLYGVHTEDKGEREEFDKYLNENLIEELHEFGFPEGFLSVGEIGNGDEIMIDMEFRDYTVVYFDHEIVGYEETWDCFLDWIEEELDAEDEDDY